jgi:hypothetical protein
MNDRRLQWQLRRLVIEIPIALLLIWWSGRTDGWPVTLSWLKFFAVNVSILVALTKKLKWM